MHFSIWPQNVIKLVLIYSEVLHIGRADDGQECLLTIYHKGMLGGTYILHATGNQPYGHSASCCYSSFTCSERKTISISLTRYKSHLSNCLPTDRACTYQQPKQTTHFSKGFMGIDIFFKFFAKIAWICRKVSYPIRKYHSEFDSDHKSWKFWLLYKSSVLKEETSNNNFKIWSLSQSLNEQTSYHTWCEPDTTRP